ncbi:Metallo-hydrolase/oxidoreductase [Auriscalpium vulgare]|uniref:Metallo-hydrolase/oxidoreductase n=1 Tax=Auriscalpium vulgare TaxID=40419 RepID=A0ACB8REA4_9AGAM|nr:Metallo-hydrolase/oxidoreductase [Auriscalpium vulgare]
MSSVSLPPPHRNQAYAIVSALEAGSLHLPGPLFLDPSPAASWEVPTLSFLLRHSVTAATLVFDLGLPTTTRSFPPAFLPGLQQFEPLTFHTAASSLAAGGLDPSTVDQVLCSHVHFDHIGDPAPFTGATFLLGAGARPLLEHAYPDDPQSKIPAGHFPLARTVFLDNVDWAPVGPFPRALDLYGDGSVYVVDAPGHMPGHVNLLVRASADGAWVYLAGDSAHDWRLVTGEAHIAHYRVPGADVDSCAHQDDVRQAEEHIGRIRGLRALPRVQVLLAHDVPWYEENRGGAAFFPGRLSPL